MLLRLISVISLIKFLLLMISGMDTQIALYRSILVFMVLFAIVYLTIFFMNVIRENPTNQKMEVQAAEDSKQNDNFNSDG